MKIIHLDSNYPVKVNPKNGPERTIKKLKSNTNNFEQDFGILKGIRNDKFLLPYTQVLSLPRKKFYLVKQKKQQKLTKELYHIVFQVGANSEQNFLA